MWLVLLCNAGNATKHHTLYFGARGVERFGTTSTPMSRVGVQSDGTFKYRTEFGFVYWAHLPVPVDKH